MTRKYKLSIMDKKILRELQQKGRITFAELANRVGLSTSPCLERVKRMEREGVISGYTALLNPKYFKAGLVVFVQIRLARTAQDIFEDFKSAAARLDEVQECYLVSGNFDYLIKARVEDMDAYRKFLGETLLTLPGVLESTSYVVMEQVKETMNVPIYLGAG
ncbi:MAG: winged helix-turn-helix transcriptional regulator [Cellvibrionales bacterium TMED148]|nr:AsnC family transcriptional regulator [Porticoccaceae bacterium]RPG92692.1 MAG: winged helix-turn-helix transcriptional regulator [Cellvibrionales bacterium TMED148]